MKREDHTPHIVMAEEQRKMEMIKVKITLFLFFAKEREVEEEDDMVPPIPLIFIAFRVTIITLKS